jgi:hypothetical protein
VEALLVAHEETNWQQSLVDELKFQVEETPEYQELQHLTQERNRQNQDDDRRLQDLQGQEEEEPNGAEKRPQDTDVINPNMDHGSHSHPSAEITLTRTTVGISYSGNKKRFVAKDQQEFYGVPDSNNMSLETSFDGVPDSNNMSLETSGGDSEMSFVLEGSESEAEDDSVSLIFPVSIICFHKLHRVW